MSFCAVFSACFKVATLPARPTSFILMNKVKVNALFDTGSSISLANGSLKQEVINHSTKRVAVPPVKLCGADGKELRTLGCYEIPLKVGSRFMSHRILFIENLQALNWTMKQYPLQIFLHATSLVVKFLSGIVFKMI